MPSYLNVAVNAVARPQDARAVAVDVAVVLGIYITWVLLYAFVLSPVRGIPGPFWSRVSSIPYKLATFRSRRSQYAQALIDRYGAVVVIAPDQIHTTDEDAMKLIYDRSAIKTKFYRNMGSWKGVVSTLGKLDYSSAAPSRNNLIQIFMNRNLLTLAEHVEHHVFRFRDILTTKASEREDIDGVVWFRLLALDIVTDVLWGEQTNLLENASDATPLFLQRFHAFSKYNAMKSFIPGMDTLVKYVGTTKWRTLRNDCLALDTTAREALDRWNEKDTKGHDRDVLSMLSSMNELSDPSTRIQPDEVPAYMVEMMAAGSSTTSHTMAFACWALTNNPEAQRTLRKELLETFPDPRQIDMQQTLKLEYLDAVIKETMRLYPMIPGPLERYTGKPLSISTHHRGSEHIAPGIIASTSAWSQGRKADVYTDPESWQPERWLDATDRMSLNWIPFGHGSRSCPGSNLALTELRYILCAIFRSFRAVQPLEHAYEAIEMADVFAAGTRSGHCWLRFEADETAP